MYKSIRKNDFDVFVPDAPVDPAELEQIDEQVGQKNKRRLPILIVPGFMSSSLEVRKSTLAPQAVGKRAWLNLRVMGFQSLYQGGPLERNEELVGQDNFDQDLHEQYLSQVEAKNKWLRHVSLQSDMVSEHDGIELRPCKGLDAVDYLVQSGSFARHAAWVFGPVIKVLQAAGYQKGVDLDAAPYDWRIPPHLLEKRDRYFSSTIQQVEQMVAKSNDLPVVLLCHSMGGKVAHYFLNFCLQTKGQPWIDQHIHTYMPVGVPHLGAPKSLRGTIEGDTMGLDAFLSDEEGMLMGRSTGSVNWLHPGKLPKYIPTSMFVRKEGILHVNVSSIDISQIFRDRKSIPKKLRLAVTFGDKTLYTNFYQPQGRQSTINFPETFCFAAPPFRPNNSLDERNWNKKLVVALEEPGFLLTKKQKVVRWSDHALRSPLRWTIAGFFVCCPCRAAEATIVTAGGVAMHAADMAAAVVGKTSTVAISSEIDLDSELGLRNPTQLMNKLMHVSDRQKHETQHVVRKQRQAEVTIRLQWEPHKDLTTLSTDKEHIECSSISESAAEATVLPIVNKTEDQRVQVEYEGLSGNDLLLREGLEQSLKTTRDHYDSDPLGPRTTSAESAPPVKRVKAVYGINLPTEIGAIYRRRNYAEQPDHVRAFYEKDLDAELPSEEKFDYRIEDGVVLETLDTPQVPSDSDGNTTSVCRSGDGTVPYFSLRQSNAWKDECEQVEIHELEGVNHRDILGDKRFHKILIDHVTSVKL